MQDSKLFEVIAKSAADRLSACYHRSRRTDWYWFEPQITYANAVLPHALFDASECWPDDGFLSIAEKSFGFLRLTTSTHGIFWPVGNEDWYSRGETKSDFDQQPLEASTMTAAALAGFQRSGDEEYLEVALQAKEWFTGQNSLGQSLIGVDDGSCCDGIQDSRLNLNRGAESTLAYLWSELLWSTKEPSFANEAELAVLLR